MSAPTGAPGRGVRLDVALIPGTSAEGRAEYRGVVEGGGLRRDVTATATAAGVELTLEPDDEALRKLVQALVRAATKVELARGEPTPRRIVRWREL